MVRLALAFSLFATTAIAQAPTAQDLQAHFDRFDAVGLQVLDFEIIAQQAKGNTQVISTVETQINGTGTFYKPQEDVYGKTVIAPMVADTPFDVTFSVTSTLGNEGWTHDINYQSEQAAQPFRDWRADSATRISWPDTALEDGSPELEAWLSQMLPQEQAHFQDFDFAQQGIANCDDKNWTITANLSIARTTLGALSGTIALTTESGETGPYWTVNGMLDGNTLTLDKAGTQGSALSRFDIPDPMRLVKTDNGWQGETYGVTTNTCAIVMSAKDKIADVLETLAQAKALDDTYITQFTHLDACGTITPIQIERHTDNTFQAQTPSIRHPLTFTLNDGIELSLPRTRINNVRSAAGVWRADRGESPITFYVQDCPLTLHSDETLEVINDAAMAPVRAAQETLKTQLEAGDTIIPLTFSGTAAYIKWGDPALEITEVSETYFTAILKGITRNVWEGPFDVTVSFENPQQPSMEGFRVGPHHCGTAGTLSQTGIVFTTPGNRACPTISLPFPQE